MSASLVQFGSLLPAFVLVLARIGGLMLAAPLFSNAVLPVRIKAMIVLVLALAIFPMTVSFVPAPVTLGAAALGIVGELAVGLFIGLGVTLLFVGVQMGAQLVGQQSGIRLGNVFNPLADAAGSILARLYFLVAMLIFLLVGGHRAVVRALLDSFSTVPPMSFSLSENLLMTLIEILTLSFSVAIRVAGPAIMALMLALLTLGFISRSVPQLNILTVGFPIKVLIALLVLAATMMSLEPLLIDAVAQGLDGIRATLAQ